MMPGAFTPTRRLSATMGPCVCVCAHVCVCVCVVCVCVCVCVREVSVEKVLRAVRVGEGG